MEQKDYVVRLIEYPNDGDWDEVRRRALVTMGLTKFTTPTTFEWKQKMLNCRHSPIRYLRFSFYLELPTWVSVHYVRHIHMQPYVASQRNDRQNNYDRNAARQDAPVRCIFDINAEELMTIMNKRLCNLAAPETKYVARLMKWEVLKVCPEFEPYMVPMCLYHGGVCHEMRSCKNAD